MTTLNIRQKELNRMFEVPPEKQVQAAFKAMTAMTEAIKELGEIPDGHLYAQVMPHMEYDVYVVLRDKIVSTGLVSLSNNLLKWVG